MKTITTLLSPAALALTLAGCMGTSNRGMEPIHQPVVQRNDYALDLATAGNGLAPGEQPRLAGWFDAMNLGYGDRISVDDGGSGTGAGARAEIGGVVAQYGLLVADATAYSAAPVTPGTVRVVVGRARASVPGAPRATPETRGRRRDPRPGSRRSCAARRAAPRSRRGR